VFLLGAHTLLEETQSLRLTEEERQDVVRDHARRLYMAMTRAGQRLVITYVGDLRDLLHQAQALTVQQTGTPMQDRAG
jgi:ATP-dependent exoDNAse (exonuclease V) beta subunit